MFKKNVHYPLDQGAFRALFFHLKRFKFIYFISFLCLLATHFTQSQLPFWATELAKNQGKGVSLSRFVWAAMAVLIFRTLSRILFFYPARVMEIDVRMDLLSQIESTLPWRYKKYSPGQMFQIIYADMEQIRAFVGFALLQLSNIVIAMAVLLPQMGRIDYRLTWALIPMFLACLIFTTIVNKNRHWNMKGQHLQGEVQNFLMECYQGKKTIQTYNVTSTFIEIFKQRSFQELSAFYQSGKSVSFSIPLIPFSVGLSFLMGAYLISLYQLGPETLIFFSGFIFLFLEPLMFVSWIGVVASTSWVSWKRLVDFLSIINLESNEEKNIKAINRDSLIPVVDFWGEKVGLEMEEKGVVVLVGNTGEGKTHILKSVGEIYKNKGRKIAYLSDIPYLYNDTFLANIFLGKIPSEEEKDRAYQLCIMLGLDTLINSGDSKIDLKAALFGLMVGENGKRLSGGQAKRLGLIRTLMSQADVLLWDDPFSSVDVILENVIWDHLLSSHVLTKRLVLMSSHRLITVKKAKTYFFLDKAQKTISTGLVSEGLIRGGELDEYFRPQMV